VCGLVGVAGFLGDTERSTFKELLIADALRGPHSTGLGVIQSPDLGSVFKVADLPYTLLDKEEVKKSMRQQGLAWIGHNRFATVGEINASNAHPFIRGDVLGAHNGTLADQSLLPDHKLFEVDSENIMYSINESSLEDTVGKLHGSMALSYWDRRDNTLNFIRNLQRPLSLAWTKDFKSLYWCSESMMLEWVLSRCRVEHAGVFSLDPLSHYRVQLPEKAHVIRDKSHAFTEEDISITKVKEYTPPARVTYRHRYWPDYEDAWGGVAVNVEAEDYKNSRRSASEDKANLSQATLRGYAIGDTVYFTLISNPEVLRPKKRSSRWRCYGTTLRGPNGSESTIDLTGMDELVSITIPKAMDLLLEEFRCASGTEVFAGKVGGFTRKKIEGYDGGLYVEPKTVRSLSLDLNDYPNMVDADDELSNRIWEDQLRWFKPEKGEGVQYPIMTTGEGLTESYLSDEEPLAQVIIGWDGRLITEHQYRDLTGEQCCICGGWLPFDDKTKTFVRHDAVVCDCVACLYAIKELDDE
jgi:hypothetical protein